MGVDGERWGLKRSEGTTAFQVLRLVKLWNILNLQYFYYLKTSGTLFDTKLLLRLVTDDT